MVLSLRPGLISKTLKSLISQNQEPPFSSCWPNCLFPVPRACLAVGRGLQARFSGAPCSGAEFTVGLLSLPFWNSALSLSPNPSPWFFFFKLPISVLKSLPCDLPASQVSQHLLLCWSSLVLMCASHPRCGHRNPATCWLMLCRAPFLGPVTHRDGALTDHLPCAVTSRLDCLSVPTVSSWPHHHGAYSCLRISLQLRPSPVCPGMVSILNYESWRFHLLLVSRQFNPGLLLGRCLYNYQYFWMNLPS